MIYLQSAAAALAFVAAIFWFSSTRVKFPKEEAWKEELGPQLTKQSKRSMYAAFSAGAASLFESIFLAFGG